MNKITLDGSKMINREITHNYLKEQFAFPYYYGNNLDALWDMLSLISLPTTIELSNEEVIYENLGPYGKMIVQIFIDAEKENQNIHLEKTR